MHDFKIMYSTVIIIFIVSSVITLSDAEESGTKNKSKCCDHDIIQTDVYRGLDEKCEMANPTGHLNKTVVDSCKIKCVLTGIKAMLEDAETINVADYRKVAYQNAANDEAVVEFYNNKMDLCQPIQHKFETNLVRNEKCPIKHYGLLQCVIFEITIGCPDSMKVKSAECDALFQRLQGVRSAVRS